MATCWGWRHPTWQELYGNRAKTACQRRTRATILLQCLCGSIEAWILTIFQGQQSTMWLWLWSPMRKRFSAVIHGSWHCLDSLRFHTLPLKPCARAQSASMPRVADGFHPPAVSARCCGRQMQGLQPAPTWMTLADWCPLMPLDAHGWLLNIYRGFS